MDKEQKKKKLEYLFKKACELLNKTEDINTLIWGLKELTDIHIELKDLDEPQIFILNSN